MDVDDIHKYGIETGAVGSALALALLGLRKFWRVYSSETVETRKDQAESLLYSSLKDQIAELRHALEEAKTSAADERSQLADRVKTIETDLRALSFKYRQAQEKALESYINLRRGCPECQHSINVSELLRSVFENK